MRKTCWARGQGFEFVRVSYITPGAARGTTRRIVRVLSTHDPDVRGFLFKVTGQVLLDRGPVCE